MGCIISIYFFHILYIVVGSQVEPQTIIASRSRSKSHRPKTIHVTIPEIRIARVWTRVSVFPEGSVCPTGREGPESRRPICDPKWVIIGERGTVSSAGRPPIRCSVNDWVAASGSFVCIREILNPSNHLRSGQAIAFGTIRVVFDIECAGQGDPIRRPTPAMGEEIVGLCLAVGFVWMRKVVSTTNQSRISRSSILRTETRGDIGYEFIPSSSQEWK